MAYLLKNSEKHTTKYRLTQYFLTSLSLGILFTLCTLYFHFVTARQYDITIEQSICLNQFYSTLDELNTDIGLYWQRSCCWIKGKTHIARWITELYRRKQRK